MDLKMKDEAGNWNSVKRMMLDSLHPVGSIYIDMGADLTTCPIQKTLGGTWAREAGGRVLVGYAGDQAEHNAIGKMGGAKTHTLTTAQMPAHTHKIGAPPGWGYDTVGIFKTNLTSGTQWTTFATWDASATGKLGSETIGGGAAHNNLQPYITVNIWRRTA